MKHNPSGVIDADAFTQEEVKNISVFFNSLISENLGKIESMTAEYNAVEVKIGHGYKNNAKATFDLIGRITMQFPNHPMVRKWETDKDLFHLILAPESQVHELKTWPEQFQDVLDGKKTFEVRKDDRGFRNGDTLRLKEYDPNVRCEEEQRSRYTGRVIDVKVTYILRDFPTLPKDIVVMSVQVLKNVIKL